jgi:large subunit ribosomal protein L25
VTIKKAKKGAKAAAARAARASRARQAARRARIGSRRRARRWFSILSCPMADARTTLNVDPRADFGSRSARRMRREGIVPGVVYSGGSEATAFQVAEREVRNVIAEGAALFDLSVDGGKARPVVIKEQQLHPVRGTLRHIDLQEVKLDEAIQADVTIELDGADDAPGVKNGGVLDHVTREITVEALPTAIPDKISVDISTMEINDTLQLSAIEPPSGVTFVVEEDEEITIATLSPPRVEEVAPEVEEETELVGEAEGDGGEADGDGDSGGDSEGE